MAASTVRVPGTLRRTDQANVAESGSGDKACNLRGQEPPMSVLSALTDALASATVEIVDLTAPLSSSTPVIKLPPPFSNTVSFSLQEISRYDDRGPACHWVTGRGGEDVSQVPAGRLIAPAVVLDFSAQAAADPDFLLEVEHIRDWETTHGALPDGGWLLYRTGWDERSADQERFLNANETGPHTPGLSVECARWLAEESPVMGIGVETVGTDAGTAHSFDPPFPCHAAMLGAGKYGLTQLQNLALL